MTARILMAGARGPAAARLGRALEERGYVTDLAADDGSTPASVDAVVVVGGGSETASRKPLGEFPAPVIVVDEHPEMAKTVAALRAGAADYVSDVDDVDAVDAALRRVIARATLHAKLGALHELAAAESTAVTILGDSPEVQRVRSTVDRVGASGVTVLIQGESGTGKEVVARALHRTSSRRAGPFIAVNCAALPQSLVESEFFGYARGAFTDAAQARAGLLLEATGGSLFLDEVSAMPLPTQAKMLRALQERAVRPLGKTSEVPFDARIIAATNVDLAEEVRVGRFREDLFFRLNVVQITLPPLRKRGSDVLLLAQHFIVRFAATSNKRIVGMTPGAADALLAYDFPGNVRELQNWMEAAVALAHHDRVTERELTRAIRPRRSSEAPPEGLTPWNDVEAIHIAEILEQAGGNKAEAARLLGIDRKTLYRKLRRYGIDDGPE